MARLSPLPPLSVATIVVTLAVLAALWLLGNTLVILFVGVLLAAVLDAAVLGFHRGLLLPRWAALGVVCLLLFAGIGAAIFFGGPTLWEQIRMLFDMLEGQREMFENLLANIAGPEDEESESQILTWLPSMESLFTHAGTAFGLTLGVIGNGLVILFLGIFLAVDPAGYRDSVVRLFPLEHRERLREVSDKAGRTLRWWLVSQFFLMIFIGTTVGVMLFLLGVENALLLGFITGSLNFIPYLGPILAAIPVFLAVLPGDPTIMVVAMGLYFIIQNAEGYILAPLVQERVVKLPPAWSMLTLTIMGTLFGGLGIAIAIPLFAVVRIFVRELYIKDVLERAEPSTLITEVPATPSAPMRPASKRASGVAVP